MITATPITKYHIGHAVAPTAINWDCFELDNATWVVLVTIMALIINLLVIVKTKDIAYSLVIIWALVGIIVKQIESQSIFITAAASATIIALALILTSLAKRA
jgi:hypothetical protein